jgi:hypothetical protein
LEEQKTAVDDTQETWAMARGLEDIQDDRSEHSDYEVEVTLGDPCASVAAVAVVELVGRGATMGAVHAGVEDVGCRLAERPSAALTVVLEVKRLACETVYGPSEPALDHAGPDVGAVAVVVAAAAVASEART